MRGVTGAQPSTSPPARLDNEHDPQCARPRRRRVRPAASGRGARERRWLARNGGWEEEEKAEARDEMRERGGEEGGPVGLLEGEVRQDCCERDVEVVYGGGIGQGHSLE